MKAKTLLLTAALTVAAAATSMAQAVYSVNVVGYINLSIPSGLSMIANQLNSTPNNSVQSLFGNPPNGITVNKFNPASGNYDQAIFDPDLGWGDPTSMVLNPGQGAFIDNPGATFTATLVGEVQLTSNVSIPAGLNVYSSVIPQSAPLDQMGFPNPNGALTVSRWNGGGFDLYIFDPDLGWGPGVPTPRVGESFFIDNAGAPLFWSRNFTP